MCKKNMRENAQNWKGCAEIFLKMILSHRPSTSPLNSMTEFKYKCLGNANRRIRGIHFMVSQYCK